MASTTDSDSSPLKERLSQLKFFKRIRRSIRSKLLASFLVLALSPIIILSYLSYQTLSTELMDSAKEKMDSVKTNKAQIVQSYFEDRFVDLNVLVDMVDTLRLDAFRKLKSIADVKKQQVETYFNERLSDISVLTENPILKDALKAFSDVSTGSEEWMAVERKHASYLVKFKELYGYYDLLLVAEDGRVVYTAAQESDLGTNLKTGKLKDSPAGMAFQKGMKELTVQDFGIYEPVGDEPVGFIAAPVKIDSRIQGVVMFQISTDQINAIMQERQPGLGKTGETYLVGEDNLFRSASVNVEESTVLDPVYIVDVEGVSDAIAGNKGEGIVINYRGEYVLSSWQPVNIHNLTWAIIADVDVTEAFVPSLEQEAHDFFSKYKEGYGYFDLYLLNPDGYMFYSVNHDPDFQTNMLTGPYKDSNFGRLVGTVLTAKDTAMADFEKYAPIENAPAAFIARPVLFENEVAIIVALQVPLDQIDSIMQDRIGLGETGETYLIGPDKMWRSESRFTKDLGVATTILNPKIAVNTAASQSALTGQQGSKEKTDGYRGVSVLSSWTPVTVMEPTEANPKGVVWALLAEMDYSEIRQPVIKIAWYIFILFVIGVIVLFFFSRWFAGGLTTQVEHIMNLFGDIGIGDFDARTEVTSEDELGVMATSLNAMLDNTLTLIQTSEERDAMQSSVMKLLEEISGLADGDLTVRAEVTEDFTGAIADSFNNMAEELSQVVKNVKASTLQLSTTSHEVSISTESLADTSEMQAVQVSDAIASINTMAKSIRKVSENASQSTQVSEQASKNASDGAEAVRNTNAAMDAIREHVQETARTIKRLGESSQEIGNIVQLINDIADRTSILALNASIQAAMAGEAGRGFAVVAEEVQRLAERSTNATQQIDTLIKNIQGEINEAGTSMEESIQRVVDGSKLADDAYIRLQEIETVSNRLAELIQSISVSSKQQARTSDDIAKTMGEVGEISTHTSSASRQTALSMQNLAQTSEQLSVSVEAFRLEDEKEMLAEEAA
ncbi:methyl-accepting chemotaxis protein [Desulfococcaceae bacterium HSG7]|nr:methyl-accepting chemotaxis protein [Desulfococcaceae bacterium HSG9]MDM8555073.1 methyl-accepting chemotaxis protein [Desulfococcaceae bacterium HSG7]